MRIIHWIAGAVAAAAILGVTGCGAVDVVGKAAQTSFQAVAAASGSRVSWVAEDAAWVLSSPAGDEFAISSDFSRNTAAGGMADMDNPDAEFSVDAAPFLAAGLDPARLQAVDGIKYELEDGRLMLHFELGTDRFAAGALNSMAAAFSEIARTQRARIGYHEKLDHYGIKLGDGNMFEWAKDMGKNDKDIVWVLNPAPFIAAGVDPAKVQGWSFAKVETKDDAGRTRIDDRFLKPFDIK
jgi:hypothetical protein